MLRKAFSATGVLLLIVLVAGCGGEDYTSVPYQYSAPPPGRLTPPNDEPYWDTYFQDYGVNPFIATEDLRFSTFGMDVDTASYTIARSYLQGGSMPPEDAVRVEEFINYFDHDYPPASDTLEIHIDGAQSRFGEDNKHLVRIGIAGRDVSPEERRDAVLTFVIDVSGSMGIDSRLGLAKRSLERLVEVLRPGDMIGIVVYGSNARKILDPTSDKDEILRAVRSLHSEGATNAEAGLRLGYRMATESFQEGKINRVILVSDGVANVGRTGPDSVLESVRKYANQHITLTTIGVGMENYNDVLMEMLADQGNGNYYYIDTDAEAAALFSSAVTGMLEVIALDAKVQVEFNPEVVDRYRLIGYENRALETDDFRDDTVDAGEVGAGHSVTALYEVRIKDGASGRVATVSIRYLDPDAREASERSAEITVDDLDRPFSSAAPEFQFAAAVAEFAEILRGSYWARESSLNDVEEVASQAVSNMEGGSAEREFLTLVRTAQSLEGEQEETLAVR